MKKKIVFIIALFYMLSIIIIPITGQAASFSAPKGLKAKALSAESIKLTWSKVKNAKSYGIYRLNGSAYELLTNTNGNIYTDVNLSGGTVYKYKIQSINGEIISPLTKAVSVITKPITPANLSAIAANKSITLSWGATMGASKYNVYIATSSSGKYKLKTSTKKLSYKIGGLTNGKKYYLKVSASNSSGESAKSEVLSIIAGVPSPAPAPAPTPDPTPAPTPAPTPDPTPVNPIIYSGTGDQAIGNINLTSKFNAAHITHTGSSNFAVHDYFGENRDLLINEIGNYSGTVLIKEIGLHTINIKADGAWNIEILPITSTNDVSFSGKGDFVTPYFSMPTNKIWTFTHDGSSNFAIWAYNLNGERDLIINEIGIYNGSQVVDLPSGKNTFFEIIADGNWTISKQ